MIRCTLQGTPPSTSHIYLHSGHRVYMSEEGKTTKEAYQWEIKSQYHDKPVKDFISVVIELYFATDRKRDVDNFNKLILDAASGLLYEDDSQIQELIVRKFVDAKNPRVQLFIL